MIEMMFIPKVDPAEIWEYLCEQCGQLRLYPCKTRPTVCGKCGARKLVIGRPGTLEKPNPDPTPVIEKEIEPVSELREIHLEERPATLKQVVGQPGACNQLVALSKQPEGLPHCILFSGPSGCGKTTLARILRKKLKCSDSDFVEVNAAENRGIEMVRGIQNRVGLSPIDGDSRVWLIDECHQLTADAQGAFLKLLEEPPGHVYFMLATTHPEKLRAAIRTRCTEIVVKQVSEDDLAGMVRRIAAEREIKVPDKVVTKLAEVAEGSPRKALVLLQQIIGIAEEAKQISVLESQDVKAAAFTIAQALMAKAPWSKVSQLVRDCAEDPESIRWMMLSYFTKVALGNNNSARAVAIMEEFDRNYYDSKKAGLVISCFNACNIK